MNVKVQEKDKLKIIKLKNTTKNNRT